MTKFIALVSGKGGVGKTTTTINLGQALTNLGKKVTLVDANLVTPNLGIHLGEINPKNHLNGFLRKENSVQNILHQHESGLVFIPASPSFTEFQKTNPERIKKIFEHLENTADIVLIDSPSGLGYEVEQVLKHSDEAVVVINPTLTSVMDALKTIELAKGHNNIVNGAILNLSNKGKHELSIEEIENVLDIPIIANIRTDKKVRKATHQQMPVNYLYPRCRASRQFNKAAEFIASYSTINTD